MPSNASIRSKNLPPASAEVTEIPSPSFPIIRAPSRALASATETFKDSLVWQLRDEPEDTKLSTVDHLNSVPGRVALVLALREFERGFVGDYGSAPGADRAIPTRR